MDNNQQGFAPMQSDPQAAPSQAPAPAPEPQGEKGSSGMAIAGLVLGIVGIITSFMPIINNVSFFIGLVGLVLAIIGMVGVSKGRKKGRGFAVAGIVLNVLTVVIVIASQMFYSSVIDSMADSVKAKPASSSQAASGDAAAASGDAAVPESAFAISIDGAREATDYEGKRAIVVTYTFTNNSDSDAHFFTDIDARAYQNGVELDTTFNSSAWNAENNDSKTVKTGATIVVEKGYELTDSSPVTVEAKEMWDFDNVILAEATFDVA